MEYLDHLQIKPTIEFVSAKFLEQMEKSQQNKELIYLSKEMYGLPPYVISNELTMLTCKVIRILNV